MSFEELKPYHTRATDHSVTKARGEKGGNEHKEGRKVASANCWNADNMLVMIFYSTFIITSHCTALQKYPE